MRSWRTCSYEELYGLEEELSEMKQEIDIRTNSILFSKFSQQEFPRIKELYIKMAKSYKILNSKFWEDQINEIKDKMENLERRLFPVKKKNKGGIKSRANREKRREKAWRETEEETFNIKKEDRKMTEKDSNKNDWNKEGHWNMAYHTDYPLTEMYYDVQSEAHAHFDNIWFGLICSGFG